MTKHSQTMNPHSPLRLDERTWDRRIALLATQAIDARAEEEAKLLRETLALLAIAPAEHAPRFPRLPSEARIEALIAAEAGETAALALLPPDAAWIVSRGANGCTLASVLLDDHDEEVAAEGATAALAVLAALAGALRYCAPMALALAEYESLGLAARPECLH